MEHFEKTTKDQQILINENDQIMKIFEKVVAKNSTEEDFSFLSSKD